MRTSVYFIPALIFILNVIIKLIWITEPVVGVDEAFTLYFANADLDTFFAILDTENNPPLFTVLLHYWIKLVGLSEFSVRFLPLLFSSFAAVALYNVGKRFFSSFVGILSSALFTFSSFHMYFAHEARPYALFGLLTILAMGAFLKLLIQNDRKQRWFLAIFNALLIYNHFFGFLVILPQFISWLIYRKKFTPISKQLWISWGITFILYIPYIPIFFTRFTSSKGGVWLDPPTWTGLYNNLWEFSNAPVNTVLFIALLFSATLTFFLRRKGTISLQIGHLIISFIFIYLLMFAVSWKIPMFLQRYLVHVSIPFYLLIALSLVALFKNKKLRWAIGIGCIFMMILTCNFKAGNDRQDDHYVAQLEESRSKGMAILISPEWYYRTYAYHYNLEVFKDAKQAVQLLKEDGIYQIVEVDDQLAEFITNYDQIALVDAGGKFKWDYLEILGLISGDFERYHTDATFEPYEILYFQRKTSALYDESQPQ